MTVDAKAVHLLPAIQGRSFGLAEFKRRRWFAELTEEQTVEQAMEQTFWRHQAEQIVGHEKSIPRGRGDIIELYKADTGEYAELLITEIGPGFVKTRLIRDAKAPEVTVPESNPFTTKWNVGKRAHDVVRKSDNAVMASGFQSKPSAMDWIDNHLKAMAA